MEVHEIIEQELFSVEAFDAYETIYTLAGLTLIGGKGSDFIGWKIYHKKLYSYFDPMSKMVHLSGKALADGLIMTNVTQAS